MKIPCGAKNTVYLVRKYLPYSYHDYEENYKGDTPKQHLFQ